jgi:hypothetical protein
VNLKLRTLTLRQNFVAKNLDRVLANEDWMGMYGKTIVYFVEGGVLDHSFAMIFIGRMKSFGLMHGLWSGLIMKVEG